VTAWPSPEDYTLSLPDALPICAAQPGAAAEQREEAGRHRVHAQRARIIAGGQHAVRAGVRRRPLQVVRALLELADYLEGATSYRSEEHTSELQSRENLVCRLLL